MADATKDLKALQERRTKLLYEREEEVRIRVADPWIYYLHDLILYRQMHARGIRIADIERSIRKELEALVK